MSIERVNPLRSVIREAVRQASGNARGPTGVRGRNPGAGAAGSGIPDTNTMHLTPDGTFTIGLSVIGGSDQIG